VWTWRWVNIALPGQKSSQIIAQAVGAKNPPFRETTKAIFAG
jgi:hypothetical protein